MLQSDYGSLGGKYPPIIPPTRRNAKQPQLGAAYAPRQAPPPGSPAGEMLQYKYYQQSITPAFPPRKPTHYGISAPPNAPIDYAPQSPGPSPTYSQVPKQQTTQFAYTPAAPQTPQQYSAPAKTRPPYYTTPRQAPGPGAPKGEQIEWKSYLASNPWARSAQAQLDARNQTQYASMPDAYSLPPAPSIPGPAGMAPAGVYGHRQTASSLPLPPYPSVGMAPPEPLYSSIGQVQPQPPYYTAHAQAEPMAYAPPPTPTQIPMATSAQSMPGMPRVRPIVQSMIRHTQNPSAFARRPDTMPNYSTDSAAKAMASRLSSIYKRGISPEVWSTGQSEAYNTLGPQGDLAAGRTRARVAERFDPQSFRTMVNTPTEVAQDAMARTAEARAANARKSLGDPNSPVAGAGQQAAISNYYAQLKSQQEAAYEQQRQQGLQLQSRNDEAMRQAGIDPELVRSSAASDTAAYYNYAKGARASGQSPLSFADFVGAKASGDRTVVDGIEAMRQLGAKESAQKTRDAGKQVYNPVAAQYMAALTGTPLQLNPDLEARESQIANMAMSGNPMARRYMDQKDALTRLEKETASAQVIAKAAADASVSSSENNRKAMEYVADKDAETKKTISDNELAASRDRAKSEMDRAEAERRRQDELAKQQREQVVRMDINQMIGEARSKGASQPEVDAAMVRKVDDLQRAGMEVPEDILIRVEAIKASAGGSGVNMMEISRNFNRSLTGVDLVNHLGELMEVYGMPGAGPNEIFSLAKQLNVPELASTRGATKLYRELAQRRKEQGADGRITTNPMNVVSHFTDTPGGPFGAMYAHMKDTENIKQSFDQDNAQAISVLNKLLPESVRKRIDDQVRWTSTGN